MAEKTSKLDNLPPRRSHYVPGGAVPIPASKALVQKTEGIAVSGAPAVGVGRDDPRMTVRMTPDEWDMLDRARGALSRNDMFRVLVRGIDRIIG